MIHYDPGNWSIWFAFTLNGSVFPKGFVWAFPCSVTSVILHIIVNDNPTVFKQVGAGDVGASVLTGFTFILGFLVVFRSQQAYARWWEGGTLLQQLRGEWFNAYSSLLAFGNQAPEKHEEVIAFQHRLARLFSLLYYTAIQQVSTMKEQNYELFDLEEFEGDSMQFMMNAPDQCEVCLQWIQRVIIEADEQKILKVAPPILSRVYNQLGNGIVNLNNARKITDFPIPFPLAQMITFMLLFHWVITAFICAASVEQSFWAGILSFIVTFSFWSINYIAVELEMPFGDDKNDLPLHEMQQDMNNSLQALLANHAQKAPVFKFNKEQHTVENLEKRRSKQFIDQIRFSHHSSHSKPDAKEVIDVNQVTLAQEVCAAPTAASNNALQPKPAAHKMVDVNMATLPQELCATHTAAPPQFAAEAPPTRTQVPMVASTCWSAGSIAATGAATALMSVTSRTSTASEPNDKQTAQGMGDMASAFTNDTQGSRVAPVVKRADAVHSKAPPDIDAENAVSMSRAPNSRMRRLQEAPFASEREKQRNPSSHPALASSVLSTSGSKVRHSHIDHFPGISSTGPCGS